jgi:HD-GYP domain-containing protein (c-di-GMP phosphodiesterase class II)
MAEATKMPEDMRKRLYRASLLHDIGFLKIWLDDNGVLPGQPDYKAHALAGYELLSPINIYSDIARAVLHHHERYDGTGYPAGLMGEDIPVESRMIAVAEAFDVISNRDSYKYSDPSLDGHGPAAGFREALIEIGKNAGTQFDPKLVDAFTHGISEDDVEY